MVDIDISNVSNITRSSEITDEKQFSFWFYFSEIKNKKPSLPKLSSEVNMVYKLRELDCYFYKHLIVRTEYPFN